MMNKYVSKQVLSTKTVIIGIRGTEETRRDWFNFFYNWGITDLKELDSELNSKEEDFGYFFVSKKNLLKKLSFYYESTTRLAKKYNNRKEFLEECQRKALETFDSIPEEKIVTYNYNHKYAPQEMAA